LYKFGYPVTWESFSWTVHWLYWLFRNRLHGVFLHGKMETVITVIPCETRMNEDMGLIQNTLIQNNFFSSWKSNMNGWWQKMKKWWEKGYLMLWCMYFSHFRGLHMQFEYFLGDSMKRKSVAPCNPAFVGSARAICRSWNMSRRIESPFPLHSYAIDVAIFKNCVINWFLFE